MLAIYIPSYERRAYWFASVLIFVLLVGFVFVSALTYGSHGPKAKSSQDYPFYGADGPVMRCDKGCDGAGNLVAGMQIYCPEDLITVDLGRRYQFFLITMVQIVNHRVVTASINLHHYYISTVPI